MKRKCPTLRPLKKQEMTQAQVEKAWEKDIALYQACASRHNTHVEWQEKRDRALVGE